MRLYDIDYDGLFEKEHWNTWDGEFTKNNLKFSKRFLEGLTKPNGGKHTNESTCFVTLDDLSIETKKAQILLCHGFTECSDHWLETGT
jgi:hypothetical protein